MEIIEFNSKNKKVRKSPSTIFVEISDKTIDFTELH